jgi:hypothetical protein
VKVECTDSKSGRHLRRSFFQEYLDRAVGKSEYRGVTQSNRTKSQAIIEGTKLAQTASACEQRGALFTDLLPSGLH